MEKILAADDENVDVAWEGPWTKAIVKAYPE